MNKLIKILCTTVCIFCLNANAQWKYVKDLDKFSGENHSHVRLKSKNVQMVGVNSNATIAELIIFENTGADIFKAAIMFSENSRPVAFSYSGNICIGSYTCEALIKIDNGELQKFPIVDSGKGDKAYVYMRVPSDEIVNNLLEAKKIEMRVAFYKKGDADFIFNSNGKSIFKK